MHDVWIMNRINMTGEGAYTRYTEMFNDAAPVHVPNFSNVQAAVEWKVAHAHSDFGEMIDHGEEDSLDN
jgi:hypothetical protein